MRKSEPAKQPEALKHRVLRFIRGHGLASKRQKLLVAVSGGPDSVCLLHILVRHQKELGINLHVAHLDHQLRGAESAADAGYVGELARRLDVPATVEKRDVKAYRTQSSTSPEEAAREVRYAFLAQVAGDVGAERVAVGHTADDQVETILLHLIRGSGTRGLRGLQPSSKWPSPGVNLTVIRPLLPLSREDTAAYCRHHRLAPRTDTSNLSPEPMRNRVRHHLLPQLRVYNPQVDEALLRTARLAADELAFIEQEATRRQDEVTKKQGDTIILNKWGFLELPPALKRHLLRAAIEELRGSLKDIEAHHVEEIMDALKKPAGKNIVLPGGLTFTIEYDRYLLGPDAAALAPFPVLEGETGLKIPGKTVLPGWDIEATIADPPATEKQDVATEEFTARFDADTAGDTITVRHRRPGDRFQPLGMNQSKKLNQFMIDARIPQAWRRRVPIVCSPEQILWVVGWRLDERVKVTADTRRVLCLKFTTRS
ncbi:tRNA lysidine(34) synthetase TilS [Chloroflexota bacterium]